MSNAAINAAYCVKAGSATNKTVFIALANRANNEWKCWPSVTKLMAETELSERAIRSALADLERRRLISREPQYLDGTKYRRSNLITLHLDMVHEAQDMVQDVQDDGAADAPCGAGDAPYMVQEVQGDGAPAAPHIEPSLNRKVEPSKNPDNASSLRSDAAPAAPNATSLFPSEKPTYTDSRHELWGEGRPILVSLGVKPTLAGQMIGQWVKQADNDCQTVLGAIQRARDERVIDPIPWITRALKTKSKPHQGSKHAERSERGSVLDGLDKLDEAIAAGFTLPPRPV
jgi:hypothetical protein